MKKEVKQAIEGALTNIKNDFLQNISQPKINWLVLKGKIELLQDISNSLLESNDELLNEIQNVHKIILNKNT